LASIKKYQLLCNGCDIDLCDEKNKRIVNVSITHRLHEIFCENMNIHNIKIVPYKINIYEKGDFFVEHVDSPEKDLLATIVVHVCGNYECMYIDEELWYDYDGDIAMFYTDVKHEIKPVANYRQTITFKVYSTPVVYKSLDNEHHDKIVDRMIDHKFNVDEDFCVLLQNGYMFYNIGDDIGNVYNNLKGNDKTLYEIMKKLGYNIRFVPVVVKSSQNIDRDSRYCDDSEHIMDEGEDHNNGVSKVLHIGMNKKKCTGTIDDIENEINIYTLCNEFLIMLYDIKDDNDKDDDNISKNLIKKSKKKHDELYENVCALIYYLGLGTEIGELSRRNVYIGNQCTGSFIENIYLNFLMVCEKI